MFTLSNPLLSITLGRVELQERDGVWCLEAKVCIWIVSLGDPKGRGLEGGERKERPRKVPGAWQVTNHS